MPTLDENDDSETDFNLGLQQQRRLPSRSGRWSSFSWSSLYERTTDSSLSWADDELEKETTGNFYGCISEWYFSVYDFCWLFPQLVIGKGFQNTAIELHLQTVTK